MVAPLRSPKQVFDELVELTAAERAERLESACRGDELLAGEVRRLLAAHDEMGSFLRTGSALDELPLAETIGTHVGRYRLVEPIGEGGFGVVFRAEQERPIRREVALKIVKPGMDTRAVIARFEDERQALARMDHPGIARVLDAGATDSGRPYFAMELVHGEPITAYCDRGRLGLRERLALFRSVCLAVQHAHQKGVIHRDLKPANVLVADGDGGPAPKVIDFGIAKATGGGRLGEHTLHTEGAWVLGTPAYMSPEQADLSGADVDTRTDVYSLGVMLYELLTGLLPFEPERLRSSGVLGMRRILTEEEPRRPSARFSEVARAREPASASGDRGTTRAGELAGRRRTDPPALERALRGELDWVVMRALEKDRGRRYGSAGELAREVERYLAHEPIEARPPSPGYLLGKLVRRHRVGVAASAAIATALVVATAVSLDYAAGEKLARGQAESRLREVERARAAETVERDKAVRHAAFAEGMLGSIDPAVAGEMDTTLMRFVLEGAAERVGADLGAHPEGEAAARTLIGRVYLAIGDAEAAAEHVDRALELRRSLFGAEHVETLAVRALAGQLAHQRGRYADAADELGKVAAGLEAALGPGHPDTLAAENQLGDALHELGRFEDARAVFSDVLSNSDPDDLATRFPHKAALNNLARTERLLGRLDDSERHYREALEISRRIVGDLHPSTLTTINSLGVLLRSRGKAAEGIACYREALEGRRKVLGEDHPSTLRTANNLSRALHAAGEEEEALSLVRFSVDNARRRLGPQHADTIRYRIVLGQMLVESAPDEAESQLRAVVEDAAREFGPHHRDAVYARTTLAYVLKKLGRFRESEEHYRACHEVHRETMGPEHYETLRTLSNLGDAVLQQGGARLTEAEALLRQAYEGRTRALRPDHPDTLGTLDKLVRCLDTQGEHARAEELETGLLDAMRRAFGPEDDKTMAVLQRAGERYLALARPADAERCFEELAAAREARHGAGHPLTEAARTALKQARAGDGPATAPPR